ncbi:L,D-transpeptidase family protein [Pseudoxanthobacter sp. M-2]|uniref:L,D-transpeptidase family protein n=1 Tax=Pseudoxanthobacter sp. M-2 TaxID=3078754 RepID=UPI0038FD1431
MPAARQPVVTALPPPPVFPQTAPPAPPLPVAAPRPAPGDGLVAGRKLPPVASQLADPLRSRLAFELAIAAADPKDATATALRDFYAGREFAPAWVEGNRPTDRARAGLARLARAGEDGLDATRYAVAMPAAADPTARAATLELAISQSFALYAREASAGRTRPATVWALATLKPEAPEADDVLATLAQSRDIAAALDTYNPPHEGYRRLKRALAVIAADKAAVDPEPVPTGPALKLGMRDPRVEVIRRRLAVGVVTADPTLYDADVRAAVMDFQKAQGLTDDGILGALTVRVLNGGRKKDRTALVLANMERWRWMPRDLGRDHVFVDVPGYELAIVRDGLPRFRTRVVVGAPTTPTPLFSDEIEFIVVNPFWNVPVSIASKEMLPSIQQNPDGYFARRNYEVVVDGRVVPPSSVSWNESTIRRVRIRQRPGDGNALGNLKFMFPNEHAVYLHDTPSKALFDKPVRAFSHGCVRVENPLAFADALLEGHSKWNGERLRKMIGGREARVDLTEPMPVHLAYFTAVATSDGTLALRGDPYGLDTRTIRALGL